MSGNTYSDTPPWEDPAVREVNLALSERVRDVIDGLCGEMVTATFDLVRAKLSDDARELGLYELAGSPEDATVPTFVAPDLLEAPMVHDEPTATLTLRLERKEDAPEVAGQIGDTLRLFLPVRSDHVYPDQLHEDEQPPEMYIEVSDTEERVKRQRYIIQPDEKDIQPGPDGQPRMRRAVFEYDSAADTGEQVVHGSLSDRMIYRSTQNRAPVNAELAMQLILGITNYDVVQQSELPDIPPEEQQTAQGA